MISNIVVHRAKSVASCSASCFSSNPLPINLNLHTTQVDVPSSTRFLHPRRQPWFGLLVVEGPLRYHEEEGECGAAEPDVECFVDVLCCEADEYSNDTGCDEEEGGQEIGETLTAEVLVEEV